MKSISLSAYVTEPIRAFSDAKQVHGCTVRVLFMQQSNSIFLIRSFFGCIIKSHIQQRRKLGR
jgi:hypothetical protein